MAKKHTYTATVTENFDIGEEHFELVKGEAVPAGSADAMALLLTNEHIEETE